jgi:pyrroloquinoline quinone (PQQ) biosynthesis protein C
VTTYDEVTAIRKPPVQAVAAFYRYNGRVPEVATQKIYGLRRFYGITKPRVLAYFQVHKEADVRHRAASRNRPRGPEESAGGGRSGRGRA